MTARIPYQLTYLKIDDVLIKVYGIVDKGRHELIQSVIDVNTELLKQGMFLPQSPNDIMPGKIVLVYYEGRYHRAEILRSENSAMARKILVSLIDVGSLALISMNDIRKIEGIKHLSGIPDAPLAEDYILSGVVATKNWSTDDIEWGNRVLQFNSEITVVSLICNKLVINVSINDSKNNKIPLAQCILNRGLAESVNLEQFKMIIYNKYGMKVQTGQFQVPPPGIPQTQPRPLFAYSPPQTQYIPTNVPPVMNVNPPPGIPVYPRVRTPRVNTPSTPVYPQQYGVETLPEGSTHKVYVSHVIDGMQSFTVQLKKNVDEKLTKLMALINDSKPEPFSGSLLPGSMCLGQFSEDKSLCRAVVSTVLAEGANLYFVDFGNSEIVPFNEIYRIPPEFMQENVIALRFTLANLSKNFTLTTQEAQTIFTDLVLDAEDLILQVTKPEMPLKQYCELFLMERGKPVNIKQKVLDKVKLMKPAEYHKIPFKQNGVADVIVSYVESPIRFFVQLEVNQPMLEILMKSVEEYCLNSEMKDILYVEDVNENMAVCAPYSGDNKWYRGLITDEPDGNGYVPVFYVDYGNQDFAHFSKLRIMNNEMISKFPMQAIECRLNINSNLALKEEVVIAFAEMVDMNSYTMKVKNVLPAHVLLVDLYDAGNQSVQEKLTKMFEEPVPLSPPILDYSPKLAQAQGNWRERSNSSNNDGDFSAFRREDSARVKPETNSYARPNARNPDVKRCDSIDIDETDDAHAKKGDFWRNDTRETKDRYPPKNGMMSDRNDWRSNGPKSRDGGWGGSRDGEDGDGRKPYKPRENSWKSDNRDGEVGDRKPFKPREDRDDWKGNRNKDDGDRKPFKRDDDNWSSNRGDNDNSFKRGGGFGRNDDSWGGNRNGDVGDDRSKRGSGFTKNDDGWGTNQDGDGGDSRPKRGGFSNRNGGNDWGSKRDFDEGDRKPFKKRDDAWGSESKNDDWKATSGDDDWKSKPRFDRGDRGGNDWGTKRDGRFNRDDNWGSKPSQSGGFRASATTLLDGYEKGAQYRENNYEEGQQFEVEVSWFMNPAQFFVIPAENQKFRQMMEDVQKDYPRRKTADTTTLSPNDCIMARDKDNVIYRAKVLRITPRAVLVTFVDYGNDESVKKDQVWTISSEHCTVPAQAICCGLYNTRIADEGRSWSQAVDLSEKYFGKNKYTVTLRECKEETLSKIWFVDLIDEEQQNVSDLLVADGLAFKETILNSENLYDVTLLRHQILTVFPGHVESSKKFFVHIEPPKVEMIRQAIANLVENPSNLIPLPAEKATEGEFCLAQATDEAYYRALVLGVDESTQQAHVLYIDYGDENNVAVDSIKILPDYLMIYNSQVVECALYGGESFEDEEAFAEAISDKDFIIKVMDVIDDRLQVYVYDINDIIGTRLPYPIAEEETVPVLCPLPVLKSFDTVVISYINTDKVYLQRTADEDFIADLCEKLNTKYEEEEVEKVAIEMDTFYAAKSAKFQAWYRCKLASPDSQEVFYIDYGNTEKIEELLGVKPLDKKFYESPAHCVGVRTSLKTTAEDLTPLIEVLQDKAFLASFEKTDDDDWFADLKCEQTGKGLADFAAETNCGVAEEPESCKTEKPYIAFENWPLNVEKKVVVSHINSPNSFYIQRFEDVEKINAAQERLQNALKKVLPVVGECSEGLYAVPKPSDGTWCRARVTNKGNEAYAIDFGFTLSSPRMKKLPKSFIIDGSKYIVECGLNVEPINNELEANAITRFTELVSNGNEIVSKLELVKNTKHIVDLKIDGTSIGALLVNENLVKYKSYDVIVSHAVSLSEFFIQEVEMEDLLYDMVEQLKEADSWEAIEVNVGDLVAAQFVDDEQWYRATITKIEDDVKYVRFVDYGNEAPCEHFRALPDSLKSHPNFAVKCTLHLLSENTNELAEKFVEFVNSAEGSYTIYFLSRVEPMLVMLYFNGVSIEEAIQQQVETVAETAPTMVAEVGAEVVYDNVTVCHINSPSSFYIQAENVPLNIIENGLVDIESAEAVAEPTTGELTAALFPDDGVWYRAKITDVTDGVVTVLFVDYGNSCAVEELRQLPETVKNIPYMAKHCAFSLPEGLNQWPDAAKERFSELTCDGNATFKFELVEEGEPAYVKLQDNGVNIVDELATLCKADMTATIREDAKPVVTISHVQSLNEIWIQYQTPQLDEMIDEMANAETFDALDAATEGSLVAALFEDDGAWYRARVQKINEPGYHVLFIDYGNESDVTKVRSLPEDLAKLPPLAKCCHLNKLPIEVTESWPSGVLARLKEIVDEAVPFTLCDLVESEKDGVNVASLSRGDGEDLATELSNYRETLKSETEAELVTEKHEVTESVSQDSEPTVNETESANEKTEIDVEDKEQRQPEGEKDSATHVDAISPVKEID